MNRISIAPLTLISCAFLGAASMARAHHGDEFLLLQDAEAPKPLSGTLTQNFEWTHTSGKDDEFSLEAGGYFGVIPRLALGVFGEFADRGNGWEFSSATPSLQLELINAEAKLPFRLALVAGYQFGFADEAGHSHGHEDEEEEHHEHAEHGHEHGNEHEHEAEESEGDHDHSGSIHQHGVDAFRAALVAEFDLATNTKLVLNLINVTPRDGSTAWGYAAGLRHNITHGIAVGVEAIGDFDAGGYHEVVGAGYFSPMHELTFKVGVGFGLTEDSPDVSLRTGLLWRF